MTKEEILDYFSDLNVVYNNPNKLDDFRKMLDKLTEQKIGRWEYLQYDANPRVGNWHCSACNNILIQYGTRELPPLYTHCPSCGARLEVKNNG